MTRIKYTDHNGKIRIWDSATPYIVHAWQIFLIESNIKGIPNYAQFCFFLAVIMEVARQSKEEK